MEWIFLIAGFGLAATYASKAKVSAPEDHATTNPVSGFWSGLRDLWRKAGDQVAEDQARPKAVSPEDLDYMARTLWGEARGEPEIGIVAVAHVILNRVRSPAYPDSVRGVVTQPLQFSVWNAGPDRERMLALEDRNADFVRMKMIAKRVLEGFTHDPTGGADHYANKAVVASYYGGAIPAGHWINKLPVAGQFGAHTFFSRTAGGA